MKTEFSCLVFFVILSMFAGSTSVQPVQVSVYYESLCPDSMYFISDQLWPTFQKIAQIFTVDLVPFGKANFTRNGHSWNFTCQHGPRECYGNTIQSCALYLHRNVSQRMSFVNCVMSAPDPVNASEKCANDNHMNWKKIDKCSKSPLGARFLHKNGQKTKQLTPTVTMIPWIIINKVYSEDNEMLALSNFLRLVCSNYQGRLPVACNQI